MKNRKEREETDEKLLSAIKRLVEMSKTRTLSLPKGEESSRSSGKPKRERSEAEEKEEMKINEDEEEAWQDEDDYEAEEKYNRTQHSPARITNHRHAFDALLEIAEDLPDLDFFDTTAGFLYRVEVPVTDAKAAP